MTYWCIGCGEMSNHEICPECGQISEDIKTSLTPTRPMINIDKQLAAMESKEEFRKMFGEYFHIRSKK